MYTRNIVMSETSDSEQVNDIVLDEPMFYILTQFLETKDGKNIATILDELTNEIRMLRKALIPKLSTMDDSSIVESNTSK